MKRKLVMLMSAMMIGAMALTGCGGNSGSKSATDEINVVSREDGSGTRGAFVELFEIEEKINGEKVDKTYEKAEITNSTSVMLTTVEGNKNAIGYISLGAYNDSIKALKIDGVEASAENIENGSYKIARPFNIVTKNKDNEVVNDFIQFILSEEGQKIVSEEKFISVDTAKYESAKPKGKITVTGSTSVAPLMEVLIEAYEKVNTNVTIDMQQNDSTTGINSTIEGTCDIGMASRELKDEEKNGGVTSQVIAMDGIAVIVNKGNKVNELSSSQVKDIFTGTVKTWSEVSK